MNLKNVLKKYGLKDLEVEDLFLQSIEGAKNIGGAHPSPDLVHKFFVDLLEEEGVGARESQGIADYYIYTLSALQETFRKKVSQEILNTNAEPIDVLKKALGKDGEEEELEEDEGGGGAGAQGGQQGQTSGGISASLGMNKRNPRYVLDSMYDK